MAPQRFDDELLDGLVESAQAGGGWAFARLWELLSPSVAGYVRSCGVREPDDVTSEVFLAAFRGLARFEGDGARFRAWLFTIAHHRAVDDLRARARRAPEFPYEPETDARTTDSAEHEALARLGGQDLAVLLGRLSPEQRDVLRLRVLADLPIEEVARLLRRSPGSVKQLQRRGLATLRRHLAADGSTGRAWGGEDAAQGVPRTASDAMTETS